MNVFGMKQSNHW